MDSSGLFQTGGSLQSQAPTPQKPGSSGTGQSSGNQLLPGNNLGNGQQDILGQGTVVGQVRFNTTPGEQTNFSAPAQEPSAFDFGSVLIFIALVLLVIGFAKITRDIIKD